MQSSNFKLSAPWQIALADVVTDPKELFELLGLDTAHLENAIRAAKLFPLRVPRSFINRMQYGNSTDPLLRQILPLDAEFMPQDGYTKDPLHEHAVNPLPGLLHKYYGRVLLTFAGSCAVNCRYCFRRSFPYADNNPGITGWGSALDYIKQRSTIKEVILSGGDPLVAKDNVLAQFTTQLNQISHIQRLRIHTRIPIVLPERVTDSFLSWIATLKQKLIIVMHCNHPQEINGEVKNALSLLSQAGVTLLNQAVLLKGVNDTLETLVALSETLFDTGILPYYIHTLDKVLGASHFDVPRSVALNLYEQMQAALPGYLVPKFVYEEPGRAAKTLLVDT